MAPAFPVVRPRRLRRPLAAGASVAVVAALGGCSSFTAPPTATQLDVIGATRTHVDVCISGFGDTRATAAAPPTTITTIGTLPTLPTSPGIERRDPATTTTTTPTSPVEPCPEDAGQVAETSGQALLAVQVPDGTSVPETPQDTSATHADFAADPEYAAAAEARQPAAAGSHWVAFRSGPIELPTDDDSGAPLSVELAVDLDLDLPRAAAGSEVELPVLGGDRLVRTSAQYAADRPTDCDEAAIVLPDPGREELPTSCFQLVGAPSLDVRDLQVTAAAGELPAIVAGATATVPFSAAFVGAPEEGTSFALAATTAVPGASARPSQEELAPTDDAAAPVGVDVAVPAGTEPGRYAVELTATTGGQVRRATRTVEVVAAPVPVPEPEPEADTTPEPAPQDDPAPTTSTEQAPPAPAAQQAPTTEAAPPAAATTTTATVPAPAATTTASSVPPAATAPVPVPQGSSKAVAPLRLVTSALERPASPGALLREGLDVPLACDAGCAVVVDLVVRRPTKADPRHVVLLARRVVTLTPGDVRTIHLAVRPSARRTLRQGPATIAVITTAQPLAGGAPATKRRKLRLGGD